jgi:hypothetical protein
MERYFVISNTGDGEIVFRGSLDDCNTWIIENEGDMWEYYIIAKMI